MMPVWRAALHPDSLTPNPLSLVRHIHPKEGEGLRRFN
ncbi:hypothetical protein OP10G_2565 [Fimbriimonas ginsengisoli Gsoil 348]|uniref:Uncharacterized protein n=1 Tax=Fimbriimonas ginsengisoli Gsoil 348 TaxID=661478 RepID=A0A068NQV9_FIMGI|nr:hypothetical protein OP10G_2565 [Fimbriimonas ginsengisoli Gsoil 348]